ncbi:MAG: hypothetical protein HYZ44_01850 [Bacteroidetes bacterium]|nr:hypothetical protein [Bacteroidota bacterium]
MGKNKILWFLWANPIFTASARLQGLAIHHQLKKIGYASGIAYIPTSFERTIPFSKSIEKTLPQLLNSGDIVILQKCKDNNNLALIQLFKRMRVTVILIDCDLPIAEDVSRLVDRIICSSDLLRAAYYKVNPQSIFIEDAPERFEERTLLPEKKKLTCVWFGDSTGHRWEDVQKLKDIFKDSRLSRWELVTISNHDEATIAWQPDYLTTISMMADVVALPVFNQDEINAAKSANRLLQSMALSIPTICSPIFSYRAVAETERGVIVCETEEDWINAFLFLENATNRKEYSEAAFQSARKHRLEERIKQWEANLQLDESFASNQIAETELKQISQLFYLELIKKNIHYFTRVPFSWNSLKSLIYYVRNKLIQTFSKKKYR